MIFEFSALKLINSEINSMNYAVLIVWVVLIILCLVCYFLIQKIKVNFWEGINYDDEKQNTQMYIDELLTNKFFYIRSWMNERPIEGFALVSLPTDWFRTMKAFTFATLKNTVQNLTPYYRSDNESIAVLSGDNVFLFTHKSNPIQIQVFKLESSVLLFSSLNKAKYTFRKRAFGDYRSNEYDALNIYNGKQFRPLKFKLFIDNFELIGFIKNKKQLYKEAIRNIVVNRYFIEKLEERYPNLKISMNTELSKRA